MKVPDRGTGVYFPLAEINLKEGEGDGQDHAGEGGDVDGGTQEAAALPMESSSRGSKRKTFGEGQETGVKKKSIKVVRSPFFQIGFKTAE